MKSLAGVIGGFAVANSAALFVALVCGWMSFLPMRNSWLAFLVMYAPAIAFALWAKSPRVAWSVLLIAAGVFWLATFVGIVASNGLPRFIGPSALAQSTLFVLGVTALGIGLSMRRGPPTVSDEMSPAVKPSHMSDHTQMG